MTRPGASAVEAAGRFHEFSLFGLVWTGYLALAGSGYLDVPKAVWLGLGLACLVALTKLAEAKFHRGYGYLTIVACLELVAAAVLSASLSFFLYLAAFLFFLVAALSSAEVRRSARGGMLVARGGLDSFAARLGGLTLFVALGILTLTTAFFFILPRTAHAAFNRFAAERYYLPGFSGEVRLGRIGAILKRNTPAMHVRILDAPGPLRLQWRGTALRSFDGRRWFSPADTVRTVPVANGRTILADDEQRRRTGARITYEVRLEAIDSDALFFAGIPEVLWIDAPSVIQEPAEVYRLNSVPHERLRYGAVSYLDGREDAAVPRDWLAREGYLQLPRIDPRIPELARRTSAHAATDEARAEAIEHYLRQSFGYSTDLPSKEVADPLANFLFERRQGYCEYFASSMAVMLRTLGIPSRLIMGFQGGVMNPISGWYVIRASDAHSWVEAWIGGRGWTSFDPTPSSPAPTAYSVARRASFYADAAEMFWQDWVVGYDLERQVTLASRMQSSGRVFGARGRDRMRLVWLPIQTAALRAAGRYGSWALVLAVLGAAAWLILPKVRAAWQARRRVRLAQRGDALASDATLLYSRTLRLLRRRGHRKPAWVTPGEFARSLPPSETATLVAGLTSAYQELRYGRRRDAAPRMIALLARLERLR